MTIITIKGRVFIGKQVFVEDNLIYMLPPYLLDNVLRDKMVGIQLEHMVSCEYNAACSAVLKKALEQQ